MVQQLIVLKKEKEFLENSEIPIQDASVDKLIQLMSWALIEDWNPNQAKDQGSSSCWNISCVINLPTSKVTFALY